VTERPASHEDENGPVRIGRRRFLGAGLAVAGAALAPAATAAAARSRAAAPNAVAAGPIPQLPYRSTFPNLPAIPFDADGVKDTLEKLAVRSVQTIQSKQGLSRTYTIDGQTRTAYEFLFGSGSTMETELRSLAEYWRQHPRRAAEALRRNARRRSLDEAAATGLSLEKPEQFSISWTNFPNVYESGRPQLAAWASSLTDADAATRQFWPMIAGHGFGYNLIIPERVRGDRASDLRQVFGSAWTAEVRRALAAGNLYVIDMSLFETLGPPQMVNGAPRFTPATMTLLIRNSKTKSLTPVAIVVSGTKGAGRQIYRRTTASKGAWLYALQAAKASVTLWGVWMGHVYHWHIVTAALQMTMYNTLPADHPVSVLLQPQSNYLIPFDDVLLVGWPAIAPPTSLTTANDFLALANTYATGRSYFDDDPTTTIAQLGLRQKDFTAKTAWDKYPVVQRLLILWNLVSKYVEAFVAATYPSDAAVAGDAALQTWIATSGSADPIAGGNVKGLPAMDSRAALTRTLTSHLYRITAHGIARLNSTSSPALTFVANFPHCLQHTDIPGPRARIDTKTLLSYLPKTDAIAQSVNFYFIFAYSTPYVPFIPLTGVGTNLYFPGGAGDSRNRALIDLRNGLAKFIALYQPDMPQRFQWPLNIET
jgi:Lipoxygenase